MTIEQQLDELSGLEYPKKVDVVDQVMAEVEKKPYLRPVHGRVNWQRISAIAAAAVVVLVAVNVVVFNNLGHDNGSQGIPVAQDNDWNTIEEEAVDTNNTALPTI
ncbi:MAG: hypothetical protein IKP21_01475 [Bacteroidales bacterium]|nr:hypothetical protein [Bacteroidales bacterium]